MELSTHYASDNYKVNVEHGALKKLDTSSYDKVIAIIDDQVLALHRERLECITSLSTVYQVTAGEKLKTLTEYSKTINEIIENGVTRKSVIVAIGGGSVGDFAGFIAATILRGIDFIQVPTTILAHDSAIGGKVGINAESGKNLIGAFKRPKAVVYDLDFLTTLPDAEKLSGFGEIIKHALLDSPETVQLLQQDFADKSKFADLDSIDYWLIKGMAQKLKVVEADEHEAGLRKVLNLGHTFGHAVEFTHHIPHGQAVMHGLLLTALLSDMDIRPLKDWFRRLGLTPVRYLPFENYYQLMLKDKKNQDGTIQFVLMDQRIQAISKERLLHAFNQLGAYDAY
ncbi:3-dehydroquinate synthase [Macrococcus brunensis]|uniref:3-dehydroquinate synthase n=1 Tax=Macrococcus brunensis TaxID=198483 RepID=UPI001EF0E062|nr:3-dehydroquinate synthase family protein [Macrococcus brunensis]ULG71024.1 3-dehydroquinate synthase [Macrococcus brunensis]